MEYLSGGCLRSNILTDHTHHIRYINHNCCGLENSLTSNHVRGPMVSPVGLQSFADKADDGSLLQNERDRSARDVTCKTGRDRPACPRQDSVY